MRSILVVSFIILPTVSASIFCFCNTPSCPQAVCKSTSQRCFTRLTRQTSADGNVSTTIMYGCIEALNSSGVCLESSLMMCCDDQLCNMPNMLRKVTKDHQTKSKVYTTHAPRVKKDVTCKCASSSPTMRVASVVVPCVLILTVILLSLAMCRKMSRYQKDKKTQMNFNVKTSPSHVIQMESSVDYATPQSVSTETTITSSCGYCELVTNPHSV